jgi:hypothetical protein
VKGRAKTVVHYCIIIHALELVEEEEAVAAERVSAAVVAVRKPVAETPKTQRAHAGVEQVLEHDVLRVLRTHAASAEHGEAGLGEGCGW